MSTMTTHRVMRLLSPRIISLQRIPLATSTQIRHASSRYSNPTRRDASAAGITAAASSPQMPSFLPSATPSPQQNATPTIENPLDARAAYLAREERRQYHLRRMRFAGMGMLLSIAGLVIVINSLDLDELEKSAAKQKQRAGQQLDASSEANQKFQGKEVQVIGSGEGKRIVAHGSTAGEEVELVETGTSSVPHFPRTLFLPTATGSNPPPTPTLGATPGAVDNLEEYTLVGLGIRSVSFLSIQVYVVGMYIRTADIISLQEKLIHHVNSSASTLIPSEKESLREALLNPDTSREIWTSLLQVPGVKTAWRIAPTRNTDFGHLRDGWITGINNRIREARALVGPGVETEYDQEDFGRSIGAFKSIFVGGKAPKGSVMILSRDTQGLLDVWFQAKPDVPKSEVTKLGTVSDERISRLIWLGYLAAAKVSSEAARKGVVEGCVGFASRPIGSVETMVT